MKICPHCQTQYTDDTLQFCLQDGAALTSADEQASMPTVALNGEQETIVKSRPDQMEFDLQNSVQSQNWQQPPPPTGAANYQTEPKKSNMGLIVTLTILATILIFGVGIAAWLYFGNDNEVARDANIKNSFPDNSGKNKNEDLSVFPPPKATEKTAEKPTTAPARDFDPETIQSEVSDTVNSWIALTESRDLSAYMDNYAARIDDYYNRRNVSFDTIRADKQRAFSTYDKIEMSLSNMRVTPDASGENATAVFDKEWYFESPSKISEGKVQSQLKLKKVGGNWKITSERDLKVYYVK